MASFLLPISDIFFKFPITSSLILAGFSYLGLSSVTVALSAYFEAILPISGLFFLSLFPPQPNKTCTFDVSNFFDSTIEFLRASGVCAKST